MTRPIRRGIGARSLRVTSEGTALEALARLLPHRVEDLPSAFERGDILDDDATPLASTTPVTPGTTLWAFDSIPDEPARPIELRVLARTERWIIIDKPHGLATMPRGAHVASTVTVAARRQFANDDVVAAHRLDALTAGLVLLTTAPQWRRPYQQLFERQQVHKVYHAVVDTSGDSWRDNLARFATGPEGAVVVPLRLDKPRGSLQTLVRPESENPNSLTDIRVLEAGPELGKLELKPRTGKTHQLRVTCAHLGMPIVGDPLYPQVREGWTGSGSGDEPLQLLAASLEFVDPVDGQHVHIHSEQTLKLWSPRHS
ncbi:MAG: pseudouridine synthase [Ancrocorticia sp.]